jgi:hypothetical protein
MTKDDIIRMAREAGIDAEADTLTCYGGFVKPLTRFATLVVANLDPKSFMSWQEGMEAGRLAEREACAAMFDDRNVWDEEVGERIRARSQA